MKKAAVWVVLEFFFLTTYLAYANHVAGSFRLPFNVNQAWPCGTSKYTRSQYFMEWYDVKQASHSGEDWNGVGCGTFEDKGAPLYALAKGVVKYANPDGSDVPSIGKVLIIRYTLPDDTQVDSVYYHLNSVEVTQGMTVSKGQWVATIGDSYGKYPPHLHWEMRRNLTVKPREKAYYRTLTIEDALKYTSPSLFVDDRSQRYPTILSQSEWTYFSVPYNAPSSTAYISYKTLNLSLKRAANVGIIYNFIYVYENGWQPYTNITQVFFQPGKSYAIWAFNNGTALNILLPGNRYRADRARQDMVRAAQRDKRFTDVKTETYREDQNCGSWKDQYYELRCLKFDGPSTAWFFQATKKSNPLLRYTGYYDPETGSWTGWRRVNWNQLG